MAKPRKIEPSNSPWDSQVRLLAWLACCVSVISFLYYFQHQENMLYGDAVAHINIARRVFDSKTPGLLQLGTVWLPLPHLLLIPFLLSERLWRTGAGGSIPSMAAYVLSVIGIFRLTRGVLSRDGKPDSAAQVAAWFAAMIYAANPNLIYMQSTAMGEVIYLAFVIWAVVSFSEGVRGDLKAFTKCGLCVMAACLTRYDGWFLAAAMTAVALGWGVRRYSQPSTSEERERAVRRSRLTPRNSSSAAVRRFVLLACAGPALWLAYNGLIYRNPLEFENGPYSAKAIARKTETTGHPGSGNPLLAGMYFMKSAEENVASNQWLQRAWVLLGLAGLVAAAVKAKGNGEDRLPNAWVLFFLLFFLLAPLPFYALSVAYGGVPVFIPQWWPFTHYNVRYGLQMLPALAIAPAVLIYLLTRAQWNYRIRLACGLALAAFVTASYAGIWRSTPICLEEAQLNTKTRNQLESQVASWLEKIPPDATLLMYLGDHVGALQRAGIDLKRTINEGNHRVWVRPADPGGLWERALSNPAQYADYVLAFEGDPVWRAVHDLHLRELVEIHVTGQSAAILYRAR